MLYLPVLLLLFLFFFRKEIGHVTAQYEELKLRFEKTVSRLEVLEEQEDQHNRVHEKMKERLKKMDEYAQFQSKQVTYLNKLTYSC